MKCGMENEMVKRVMKAIAACPYPEGDDPLDDETLGEAIVRAAIAAMRVPTDQMRTAYYELSHRTEFFFDAHWERAIDAILKSE